MSNEIPVEQRLAAFEQRLAVVEATLRQLQSLLPGRELTQNWMDHVVGSVKDEPAFLEALKYGRAYRQSDRPPEEG